MSPQTLNCFVRIIIFETKYFAIKNKKGKKLSLDKTLMCVGHNNETGSKTDI